MKQAPGRLKEVRTDKVTRNPDNPRIFFRPEEMDTLLASIRQYGIQVPVTVYQSGDKYTLIDGERRWRCAHKLNLRTIPALVQPPPGDLQNLLLMFNIHALREQWDYLTIANKLPNVIALYKAEHGSGPKEDKLSEITGLTVGQIRRCKFLLDIPSKYKKMLEQELRLPKHLQRLSEDLFIEMERSLKTVTNRLPDLLPNLNVARDVLIKKFRDKTINNVTDFRKLSKIATSIRNLGIKEAKAANALAKIFDPHEKIGIAEVYTEQFESRYDQKRLARNLSSLHDYLDSVIDGETPPLNKEIQTLLGEIRELIDKLLDE